MIKDGKKILEMMKYNRILCEEISLLFRTTDEQMKEKGWEAYNNVVTYDMSKKYFEPKKWFPNYLFRFYIKSEAKHILAYISILLDDDIENEYEEKMMEPLITAGFFDFGEDNEVTKDNWKPWYAKWYGYYRENGKDDGTIYEAGEKWQDDFGQCTRLDRIINCFVKSNSYFRLLMPILIFF